MKFPQVSISRQKNIVGDGIMKNKVISMVVILAIIFGGVYYLTNTDDNSSGSNEGTESEKINEDSDIVENNEGMTDGDEPKEVNVDIEEKDDTPAVETKEEENNKEKTVIESQEKNSDNRGETKEVVVNTNLKDSSVKSDPEPESVVDSKEENTSVEAQQQPEPEEIKPTPEEIEAGIVKKHTELFTNLKNEYEIKINEFIEKGKTEYLSLSEEERKKQKLKLGIKYLKLGRALESECDEKFYGLLDQMKKELKENDLKMDSADEAEKQYKTEKSERRKQLLEKAMEKG